MLCDALAASWRRVVGEKKTEKQEAGLLLEQMKRGSEAPVSGLFCVLVPYTYYC